MTEEVPLDSSARFRHFDWEKAKTFYYVSRLGSFTKAADFLKLSQPALSRQIMSLEQRLGCPLFVRHATGVKMTRKGEELATIIKNSFLNIKRFTNKTHAEVSPSQKRKIRIAATHAVSSYILADLVLDYNKDHPHLIFELIGDDHLIDVILNDVDIAVRPIDPRIKHAPIEQGIQQEYLFSLEKKLFASIKYLEEYGEPQTVEDLRNHHIIALAHPEEHPYADVNWILRLGMPKGKSHEPIFTSNSLECLIEATKSGLGIVSSYEEMSIIRNANLKNILPDFKCEEIKDYFIYPDYLKKDKEILDIKKYLKERLSPTRLKNQISINS